MSCGEVMKFRQPLEGFMFVYIDSVRDKKGRREDQKEQNTQKIQRMRDLAFISVSAESAARALFGEVQQCGGESKETNTNTSEGQRGKEGGPCPLCFRPLASSPVRWDERRWEGEEKVVCPALTRKWESEHSI